MRNLTELSLRHRSVVWYFIIVFAVGGILAYESLGRMEDPSFIIRQMVITAAWPGATAEDMQEQVTDKLERRFQDTPGLKEITSETRAGQTIIYVDLRDDVDENLIRPTWRDVRNFGEDVKSELPDGVIGPFYNDRFDDVYGSIYAVTGEDYTDEELRAAASSPSRAYRKSSWSASSSNASTSRSHATASPPSASRPRRSRRLCVHRTPSSRAARLRP